MMMSNHDPNLMLYACIAKETIILGEFNTKDADFSALALDCLHKTPHFHSFFSHTIRNKTYMFLSQPPFVYFGIFDTSLHKSSCILFLNNVSRSFNMMLDQNPLKRLTTLNAHCFQADFSPIFHHLLSSSPINLQVSTNVSECLGGSHSLREDEKKKKKKKKKSIGGFPLFGGSSANNLIKKKRLSGELPNERKVDVMLPDNNNNNNEISLSREFSPVSSHNKNGLFAFDKAKLVWKKQVWMVLLFDLIVCCVLFGVWLWICKGFECIAS